MHAIYGRRKVTVGTSTRQRLRPARGACDEAACSPTPNCRTRSLQYPDPLLLRSLSLISSCRGPGGPQLDDMSRKHRTAAATACTWGVRRGRMLADDELQDTQTAVPRPVAGAQPVAASYSGWGSTNTEFSQRGGVSSAGWLMNFVNAQSPEGNRRRQHEVYLVVLTAGVVEGHGPLHANDFEPPYCYEW